MQDLSSPLPIHKKLLKIYSVVPEISLLICRPIIIKNKEKTSAKYIARKPGGLKNKRMGKESVENYYYRLYIKVNTVCRLPQFIWVTVLQCTGIFYFVHNEKKTFCSVFVHVGS